jgi:hypothetical protein
VRFAAAKPPISCNISTPGTAEPYPRFTRTLPRKAFFASGRNIADFSAKNSPKTNSRPTPYDFSFLEYLFKQPIATVRLAEQHLKRSYVTANKVVERFVTLHLLEEMTGFQRNRRFRCAPYLALFESGPPASTLG